MHRQNIYYYYTMYILDWQFFNFFMLFSKLSSNQSSKNPYNRTKQNICIIDLIAPQQILFFLISSVCTIHAMRPIELDIKYFVDIEHHSHPHLFCWLLIMSLSMHIICLFCNNPMRRIKRNSKPETVFFLNLKKKYLYSPKKGGHTHN